jgi:hypothetical protein
MQCTWTGSKHLPPPPPLRRSLSAHFARSRSKLLV